MTTSIFYKRYRMQIDLASLPDSAWEENSLQSTHSPIAWLTWHPRLVGLHARAKWESFRNEMDGNVFPCLADHEGCKQLMRDITSKSNFVPEATWLAVCQPGSQEETVIGTIQGLQTSPALGAIQNIGVVPAWRGRGIGRELIRRSLQGFRDAGCRIVTLEVTVHNLAAIRLYQTMGFVYAETVFKYGVVPMP
jgi:hypothetical protein